MSSASDKMAQAIIKSIDGSYRRKPKPYETEAEVVRVPEDGNYIYVKIPGGVDETPVRKTVNAKVGDKIHIRVTRQRAYVVGNYTAPPTDDTTALMANRNAVKALKSVEYVQKDVDEIDGMIDRGDLTVDHVETEYCLSDYNDHFVAYGDWSSNLPDPVTGKWYWKRTVTYYRNGKAYPSEPTFDQSNQIEAEVAAAFATANSHFWNNETGAYVTQQEDNADRGYALRVTPNGILQTFNGSLLTAWANSAVRFYQSDGETPMADYGSGEMVLYYATGNQAMELNDNAISFYDKDGRTILAYLGQSTSQNLYGLICDVVEAQKYFVIGNFVWVVNSDGGLTLKKVGA